MTAARMSIECPASGCGHQFADRNRAALISGVAAVEVNRRQESVTRCPECGQVVELGLLMLDEDGVWRVSRFAGHADDVTVIAPPGGGVSYEAGRAGAPGTARAPSHRSPAPDGLSTAEGKLRDRALAVLDGRAPNVSRGAQRDAVELAIEARALRGQELAGARAWLERRQQRSNRP